MSKHRHRTSPALPRSPLGIPLFLAALLVAVSPIWPPTPLFAYTTSSPEVKEAVARALNFMAENKDQRMGARILTGFAFVKAGQLDHPRAQEAAKICVQIADPARYKNMRHLAMDPTKFYEIPVAVIFLSEYDPSAHYVQIETLVAAMAMRQQENGGWGYSVKPNVGDTSMTQYNVLAAWTAHRSGIKVPPEMVSKACAWLLRTQTPEGAWGYQANDPGINNFNRRAQEDVRMSLAVAGAGSVYICADLFGVSVAGRSRKKEMSEVPACFRPVAVGGAMSLKDVATAGLATRMRTAVQDADAYIEKNFRVPVPQYPFYYLYALERYHAYREIATGQVEEAPPWYGAGVEYLLDTQQPDGSWKFGNQDVNTLPSTAFATLFLLRSSYKALQIHGQFGEGMLVGGRGLPTDLSDIRVEAGRIVGRREKKQLSEILAVLEDPSHPQFDRLAADGGIALLGDAQDLSKEEADRLRRLIQGGDYQVRKLAVEALGSRRRFEDIPLMIYALSDPDDGVSIAARDALRFTSRRLDGFGMSNAPSDKEKQAAVAAWRAWYAGINPSAKFVGEE